MVGVGGSASGGASSSASGGSGSDFVGDDDGSVPFEPTDFLGRVCDRAPPTSLVAHVIQPNKSRFFYTWTTEAQEQGLREGDPLYSVGEVPGKGRGRAADLLFAKAEAEPDSLAALVAPFFETCRYGWPHPWPTRFGVGGEMYGDKLIKIQLKPEAWVAVLSETGDVWTVYDSVGQRVPREEALAHPERVGALYFVYVSEGDGDCGSFGPVGMDTYREFVLGNEEMVLRYEVGTEAILSELEQNRMLLGEYLRFAQRCSEPEFSAFVGAAACTVVGSPSPWSGDDPYIESLAIPSETYLPTVENLTALIDSLTAALFEPDPFVVEKPE